MCVGVGMRVVWSSVDSAGRRWMEMSGLRGGMRGSLGIGKRRILDLDLVLSLVAILSGIGRLSGFFICCFIMAERLFLLDLAISPLRLQSMEAICTSTNLYTRMDEYTREYSRSRVEIC
jgi:hypothetical protein